MGMLAALIQAGVGTAIIGLMLALVRIAIRAERGRADDWRNAAQTTAAANEVLSSHVGGLVSSQQKLTESVGKLVDLVQKLADSEEESRAQLRRLDDGQRESLTLLRKLDLGRAV